jgi:flagellar biosynthesis/type III secretory pathway protein FliH
MPKLPDSNKHTTNNNHQGRAEMIGWRPNREERKARKLTMAFGRGYAKGFEQGSLEMKEYLTEQIIYSINQDAVLRTNADVDTLERIVEVIEAVRDIGKA